MQVLYMQSYDTFVASTLKAGVGAKIDVQYRIRLAHAICKDPGRRPLIKGSARHRQSSAAGQMASASLHLRMDCSCRVSSRSRRTQLWSTALMRSREAQCAGCSRRHRAREWDRRHMQGYIQLQMQSFHITMDCIRLLWSSVVVGVENSIALTRLGSPPTFAARRYCPCMHRLIQIGSHGDSREMWSSFSICVQSSRLCAHPELVLAMLWREHAGTRRRERSAIGVGAVLHLLHKFRIPHCACATETCDRNRWAAFQQRLADHLFQESMANGELATAANFLFLVSEWTPKSIYVSRRTRWPYQRSGTR